MTRHHRSCTWGAILPLPLPLPLPLLLPPPPPPSPKPASTPSPPLPPASPPQDLDNEKRAKRVMSEREDEERHQALIMEQVAGGGEKGGEGARREGGHQALILEWVAGGGEEGGGAPGTHTGVGGWGG